MGIPKCIECLSQIIDFCECSINLKILDEENPLDKTK